MVFRRLKINDVPEKKHSQRISAAALAYQRETDNAPRVVASGHGKIAEQIITLAKANDIPVYDDPVLTEALSMVNLGEEIPPELYLVVAEVLAYIYRVARKQNTP